MKKDMNKKVYMTPAVEVEKMELETIIAASITSVGGDSGIDLGDGEIPAEADSRLFGDDDFGF